MESKPTNPYANTHGRTSRLGPKPPAPGIAAAAAEKPSSSKHRRPKKRRVLQHEPCISEPPSKQQKNPPKNPVSPALLLELRDLMQSDNTGGHSDAALNLFNAYRKYMGLPEHPTATEFEVDNLREFIIRICHFAESRAIPIYFDEDLMPRENATTNRCCTEVTLAGYIGKIIQWLRRQLPNHEEFIGLDPKDPQAAPVWWTHLRQTFLKNCADFQNKCDGDYTFGTEDIRPLYRDVGCTNEGGENADFEWGIDEHPMSHCDLKSILVRLLKEASDKNENLEHAALMLTTYDAVGRGGEAKFQTLNDWNFDFYLQILDTMWRESKRSQSYAMSRVADDSFLFDFFYIHGAFAMGENGLHRTPEQVRDGKERHVYPSLHGIHNNSVAYILTKIIRNNLPASVPMKVRAKYSSKSLRQAAINEMSLHKDIGPFEASARSGHAIGNSIGSYLDPLNPLRSLPAAQALHVSINLYYMSFTNYSKKTSHISDRNVKMLLQNQFCHTLGVLAMKQPLKKKNYYLPCLMLLSTVSCPVENFELYWNSLH